MVDEAALGDPDAAKRRLAMLADMPILDPNHDNETVADKLVTHSLIPESARLDASYVATAATISVDAELSTYRERDRFAACLPLSGCPRTGRPVGIYARRVSRRL